MNKNALMNTLQMVICTGLVLLFSLLEVVPRDVAIGRSLDPNISCTEVDWEEWYSSGLRYYGTTDTNTPRLLALVRSDEERLRYYSILLLGHRQVKEAIPLIEDALKDESFSVRLAAAKALLKLGSRTGLGVLERDCEAYLAELTAGNNLNVSRLMDAASALARAGEVGAARYLRRLLKYDSPYGQGIRLNATRSLAELYSKDPTVVEDIRQMCNDPDGQVRTEAMQILRRLRPDHPSVSLEVLHGSIYIRDAKKGRATKRTIQIKDKRIDPNQLGSLQIVSIETMEGSKVKLLQTRPVKGGCQIDLEIQDPNVPGAIDIQGANGQVRGLFVDYLVIRFTDGRELTVPVWFYFRQ